MSLLDKKIAVMTAPVRRRLNGLFRGKENPKEVYGLLSEFLSVEGKLLRPALCLASCKSVGGSAANAVHAAAAIEMFHNFTLIHDDIEDGSLRRRGHPCMHFEHGLPLALNAGDGLFMLVWRETMLIRGSQRENAWSALLKAFTRVLEGQAIELGWYQDKNWDIGVNEYYQVIEGKTGALISVACEVGGLMGEGSKKECSALSDFGMGIGVGFQMVDDVLNIVGDEKKYGKEIGGDIVEGKRTLITIRALEMLSASKSERLCTVLKKERKSKKDVLLVVGLLKESGAVESVMETAERTVERAMERLDVIPECQAKKTLVELGEYITRREK